MPDVDKRSEGLDLTAAEPHPPFSGRQQKQRAAAETTEITRKQTTSNLTKSGMQMKSELNY
jgi:hypothetical protein